MAHPAAPYSSLLRAATSRRRSSRASPRDAGPFLERSLTTRCLMRPRRRISLADPQGSLHLGTLEEFRTGRVDHEAACGEAVVTVDVGMALTVAIGRIAAH